MANEEKAKEIAIENSNIWDDIDLGKISTEGDCYESAMAMANYKDAQPISELGGWQTECTVGQLRMFLAIEGLNEIAKQLK